MTTEVFACLAELLARGCILSIGSWTKALSHSGHLQHWRDDRHLVQDTGNQQQSQSRCLKDPRGARRAMTTAFAVLFCWHFFVFAKVDVRVISCGVRTSSSPVAVALFLD